MKSYSVTEQTDVSGYPAINYTLMAGTIYNIDPGDPNKQVVHFLRVNDNGRYASTTPPTPAIPDSKTYDGAGYLQERAIAIVGDGAVGVPGTATYYIISSIRPFASADDQIRVQPVLYNGNSAGNASYIQATAGANPGGIVPVHAIYHTNGLIYICGYWYDDPAAAYPNAPGYATNKQGFILSFDPVNRTVVNTVLINTDMTGAPIPITQDYDIAMRIAQVPGAAGNVHVTGGVNSLKTNSFGANEHLSATMNIVFPPNLNNAAPALPPTPVYEESFSKWVGNNSPGHEYGIGFCQSSSTGRNYILGNKMWHNGGNSMGQMPTGFDLIPYAMFLNVLDANFAPVPGFNSRQTFDPYSEAIWGLQLMESPMHYAGDDNLRIVGMQTIEPCNVGGVGAANAANVVPFIWDIHSTVSTQINAVKLIGNSYTLQNLSGTGAGGPNCYLNLGCDMDVAGWNSTIAERRTNLPALPRMALYAPKWNTTPGLGNSLNFKSVRVDDNDNTLTAAGCATAAKDCPITNYPATEEARAILGIGTFPVTVVFDEFGTSIGVHSLPHSNFIYPLDEDCSGTTYKTGATTGVAVNEAFADATRIYPNPASTQVTVALAQHIADEAGIEIVLLNVMGQQVGRLYKGSAALLRSSNTLPLPLVAAGMYTLQVYEGRTLLHHQKLAIQ
jgi:hypothetical protein